MIRRPSHAELLDGSELLPTHELDVKLERTIEPVLHRLGMALHAGGDERRPRELRNSVDLGVAVLGDPDLVVTESRLDRRHAVRAGLEDGASRLLPFTESTPQLDGTSAEGCNGRVIEDVEFEVTARECRELDPQPLDRTELDRFACEAALRPAHDLDTRLGYLDDEVGAVEFMGVRFVRTRLRVDVLNGAEDLPLDVLATRSAEEQMHRDRIGFERSLGLGRAGSERPRVTSPAR